MSVQLGSNGTTPLSSIAGAPPGEPVQTAMQAVNETLPSRLSAPVLVTITATAARGLKRRAVWTGAQKRLAFRL